MGKKMSISVFEIQTVLVGINSLNLSKELHSALDITTTAKERLMPLNDEENEKDSDLILNFSYGQGFLFGSFIRLNSGEESSVLLASLDKKTVEINEIISEAKEGSAGSIRDKSFFCILDDLMVMTGARLNRKALEIYIDWIIREKLQQDIQIEFIAKKNTAETIPVKNIKNIKVAGNYLNGTPEFKNEKIKITTTILKKLFKDTKDLSDFADDDIVDATLILKINKRKLKDNNAKALDTALRLIDNDNIIITGNDGKTLKGTEYVLKVIMEIEGAKSGKYNEKAIETEMRKILKAVKNGEMVT